MWIARDFVLSVLLFSSLSAAQGQSDNKLQTRESGRKRDSLENRSYLNAPSTRSNSFPGQVTAPVELAAPPRAGSGRRTEDLKRLFAGIQEALLSGNVNLLASNLGTHVMLNLRDGQSGLFSSKQAYYVLENYLQTRKIFHLDLTPGDDLDSNPYATGSAGVNVKGSKESVQVYVAVARAGDRWVITQITFS